jgi:hypothetical protein
MIKIPRKTVIEQILWALEYIDGELVTYGNLKQFRNRQEEAKRWLAEILIKYDT